MKKQPEITKKTRDKFTSVFCELYSQKPIEKISVQEIAEKSGYNRSTFYEYFADIYELLTFVENDLLSYMKEELNNKDAPTNNIQNMMNCFEDTNHILTLTALLGDYGSIRFLERIKSEIPLDRLVINIPKDDPRTPYLIEFYISTALSLFRLWIRREKDITIDELSVLLNNLFRNGISSI